ncbi:MAG TPA: hypothetical protein VG916_12145, partial [Gemmatimonadaceae bacterium]|nr:hypothetical protein [Gemmatimonadaceae bacterium]
MTNAVFQWAEIRHVADAAGSMRAVAQARISPPEWILAMTTVTIAGASLFMVARAVSRRIEGANEKAAAPPPDVLARLDRIEAGVEAIALEVERITENQRFVTQLLSG